MVIFTVLAIVVTVVQFLHCFTAVVGMEAGLGKRPFVVLFPGLVSLLALYILRAYILTHYNNSSSHLSRAIYAMLYFTEQFSNILIAASTMIFLYRTERDWYQNTVILAVRKGLGLLFLAAWLALVVAQTITYRLPSDVDHNALLTIALYQDKLTHAIIGFYNLVTLDIAVSSFVLWIHARKYWEPESEKDHHQHTNTLLLITHLLAIRSLFLLVVHILSLVSIPPHLVNTVWTVIFVGWLMLDPTLCYAALYALLRASGIEPPIRFRQIVLVCGGIVVACFSCVSSTVRAMPHTETEMVWVPHDPVRFEGPPE
ncbi:hypothetical protein MVEN_02185300 [Mycena venus]|uniref:Uncharacterized protein n=1 Tax=Mycena venus TaxID=2733690 RepID=A0A8H6X8G4_9AGAR|nr:hypothetical protein MVEN_02185300 [Mycena venus]